MKNDSKIGIWMVVGIGAGAAIGVAVKNIAVGIAAGAAIGILIGALVSKRGVRY